MANRNSGGGGNYAFPQVDFSPLATLPALSREAKMGALRESLADLDPNDPKQIDKAASRLLAGGDVDAASKLYQASTARQAAEQRNLFEREYLKQYPEILKSLRPPGAGGAPGVPGAPPATYTPPDTAPDEPAPARPALPAWPSGPQPPAGGLPQPGVVTPPPPAPPPPAPRAAVEPPDTGRISEALAPPPRLPPGPQTAQLGPPGPMVQSPNVPPPASPGGLPPGYEIGRQAPGAGALPPGFDPRTSILPSAAPAAPPPAPAGRQTPFPVRAPEDTSAADRAYWDALRVGALPKAPPGLAAAARLKFQNELEKSKRYSPDEIKYATDQLHRKMLGQPQVTRQEFDRGNQIFPKVFEEAQDYNKKIQERGEISQGVTRTMESLRTIVNNPDFKSGVGAGMIHKAQGFLLTLAEQARAWGVPENLLPTSADINVTDTIRLQNLANSLVNSTVLKMLDSKVGAGTSNRDVQFITSIIGGLSSSVEGQKDIIEFLHATAKNEVGLANKMRAYINKVGKTQMDPNEMRQIAQDYSEEHSILHNADGSLTPLGERMQGSIQLGGGRTPLQAFQTSDVANALQDASRYVGTPIREMRDIATQGMEQGGGVPVPVLNVPGLPTSIPPGGFDVSGTINRGVSAVSDFLNNKRDIGKYTRRPDALPPEATPAQAGPSGGPFPGGGVVMENERTGERIYILPTGQRIRLPKGG